jgi:hypothetical protein
MRPNEFILSRNKLYTFMFTLDRELVVLGPQEAINGGFLWRMKTGYGPNAYVYLNNGGRLTIHDPDLNFYRTFSRSGVSGEANSYAVMQDDGNFVVYTQGNKATWATGTDFRARECPLDELDASYGKSDSTTKRNAWCECRFLPGTWTDKSGTDALTRCKEAQFWPPWTNEGAGARALPTGEGLVAAFLANSRAPSEEELELDYLASLMFTDTARWASIMCYAGFRSGGVTFLGPLGLVGTAFDGLWSLISAPFDEGKRLRYFEKMAAAWYGMGMPIFSAGLTAVALIVAGTVAGTVINPGLGTTIGAGVGLFLGSLSLIQATGISISNAARMIEKKNGDFRPPWTRGAPEKDWPEEKRLKWTPSPAALQRASKYWYPANIAYQMFCSKLLNPGRYINPLQTFLEDGCELAAALIPKSPSASRDLEVESVRLFVKALGRLASPLVLAFVEKKGDAIKSESTWQTVSTIFEEGSKIVEDEKLRERFIDWADFFFLFKSSVSRAAGYALEPTPDNFKKLVCCDVDSAFDRMPQAFVQQNMSALSKSLDAILGKPVDGKVLSIQERVTYAQVFTKLNAKNVDKFLRLVERLVGFFDETISSLKNLGWDALTDVVNFISSVLSAIRDALNQARAFIQSLIRAAESAPPLPDPKKDEDTPKSKKQEGDGLLAALLLGAGGGFVVGGPPGALVGAGAAVALSSK